MQEDNRVMYILKTIWPVIYKIINNAFYFVITVIRAIVKGAMDQIRNY